MKALNIVESAYRGTIEEQDDTILWLNAIFKNNGLENTVLLRSNSVNYAVEAQDASGLRFGSLSQGHPTDIGGDVKRLLSKGVPVKAIEEDLDARGIDKEKLIAGVEIIPKSSLIALMESHDQVWHW